MANLLLVSTPLYGHLRPMITIGGALVRAGHRVSLLTGAKYAAAVAEAGMTPLTLPPESDYDDAHLERWLPERGTARNKLAAGRRDIIGLFVRPLPGQYRALSAALAAPPTGRPYDAVLAETAFLGALPLVLTRGPGERIPVLGVSVTPLSLVSIDCAPFGSGLRPGNDPHSRWRNNLLNNWLAQGPLRPVADALDEAMTPFGVPPRAINYFDHTAAFDETFHLAPPELEYPRREMPASIRFVGPLPEEPSPAGVPAWWDDLDGSRPVVHVTQGTMDNADFNRLVVPTIRALRGSEALVVASTGGRPTEEVLARLGEPLPANARVARFLPYDRLLPRIDAMVTNGGFGGVQQALRAGVPVVVAGSTEDKPEVATRVAWAGVGINLHSGTPPEWRIRRAVRSVLRRPRYRERATRLADRMAAREDPLSIIVGAVERAVAGGERRR